MIKEYLPLHEINKSIEQQWEDRWDYNQSIDYYRIVRMSDEFLKIRPYLKLLASGANILDAGCGLGHWTVYLAHLGYKAIGVDIGRTTIECLKKKYPQIRFESLDINNLPYKDNTFDAYVSWGVIEHFEDGPERCLKEAWRILKPGGLLFASVPFHNIRISLIQKIRGTSELVPRDVDKKVFYQYRFKKTELEDMLFKAGFLINETTPIHKWHGFQRFLNSTFNINIEKIGDSITEKTNCRIFRKIWLTPFYFISKMMPSAFFSHMLIAIAKKR